MKHLLALTAAVFATPLAAQEALSPGQIVAEAEASEWVRIAPEDLLVMTLAPDARGRERRVVIQLIPEPFSQGWVENIRTLARAGWYDGLSINRVQDNYVVQWGDSNGEDAARAKALPTGFSSIMQDIYEALIPPAITSEFPTFDEEGKFAGSTRRVSTDRRDWVGNQSGSYGFEYIDEGWPQATNSDRYWPVHCYATVGVGRGLPPDTGSGAELYAVIGHAPRHLDRNTAVVGRVVEGIEHLSSLPRGTGELGFYETAAERVPIRFVRLASDLPPAERPQMEYLSTESETFARYAETRANRRDPFFVQPAGGADVCNIPVPVRRVGR